MVASRQGKRADLTGFGDRLKAALGAAQYASVRATAQATAGVHWVLWLTRAETIQSRKRLFIWQMSQLVGIGARYGLDCKTKFP